MTKAAATRTGTFYSEQGEGWSVTAQIDGARSEMAAYDLVVTGVDYNRVSDIQDSILRARAAMGEDYD